ncbi:IS66 family transposase, partial [Paraburkholderia sabiae]
MDLPVDLTTLSPDQLRALAAQLAVQLADREREVGEKERELQYRQTRIDQLTHELSVIKRQQFGKRS